MQFSFQLGTFAEPIFSNGDYPEAIKQAVAAKSKKEGFAESVLIQLSQDDKKYVNRTFDFFGLNYYETEYAAAQSYGSGVFTWIPDVQAYVLKSSISAPGIPKVSWHHAKQIRQILWHDHSHSLQIASFTAPPLIHIIFLKLIEVSQKEKSSELIKTQTLNKKSLVVAF